MEPVHTALLPQLPIQPQEAGGNATQPQLPIQLFDITTWHTKVTFVAVLLLFMLHNIKIAGVPNVLWLQKNPSPRNRHGGTVPSFNSTDPNSNDIKLISEWYLLHIVLHF